MKMKKLSLQKKNKIFHKNCLYENEKKCTGIEKNFFENIQEMKKLITEILKIIYFCVVYSIVIKQILQ